MCTNVLLMVCELCFLKYKELNIGDVPYKVKCNFVKR